MAIDCLKTAISIFLLSQMKNMITDTSLPPVILNSINIAIIHYNYCIEDVIKAM